MGSDYEISPKPPTWMDIVQLDQAGPVQWQWYPVFDEINARIVECSVEVLLAGETLEGRLTVDGIVMMTAQIAVPFGTSYRVRKHPQATPAGTRFTFEADNAEFAQAYLLEGRHVIIELRKVTAAGAGNLRSAVLWNQY